MQDQKYIEVIKASENNLQEISLKIPRNKFIVVTGLSGSGKSTLAFDTLYAEGQRRYVESLSSYARQFLGRIKKPAVENIIGLPPAIAIEQQVRSGNSHSTVGTSSEIYDYLKLLYAGIGKTYSPVSGKLVKKHYVSDVVDYVMTQKEGAKVIISANIDLSDKNISEQLEILWKQGFYRVEIITDEVTMMYRIDELQKEKELLPEIKSLLLVIDRLKVENNTDVKARIADSVQTAFFEGSGYCVVKITDNEISTNKEFSNLYEADGINFELPNVNMFNFNNPLGACETCKGFGKTIGIDEKLVIPDTRLSIYEGAVACWHGDVLKYYNDLFIKKSTQYNFPIHKPYSKLTDEQKDFLWNSDGDIIGITAFFDILEQERHKIQNRVLLSRYRGKTVCPECRGSRLKKSSNYVKINNKSISDLVLMQIKDLKNFIDNCSFDAYEQKISKRIIIEIRQRVDFMVNVGLGYLTLNRASSTLSGGETQRINIATALGSSLIGSLYVLDEPTIGLHARDTDRLLKVIRNLQKLGNTVLVVEHEKKVIESADWLIDLGPYAGTQGGKLVFEGTVDQIKQTDTLTGQYLSGKKQIKTPKKRRQPSDYKGFISIGNAFHNNLKNISLKIPLGVLVAVSGVSGSGKTSLIKSILYASVARHFGNYSMVPGNVKSVSGDLDKLHGIEYVDQKPIGRSSRSNPATYMKIYDDIRKLYASQKYALINNMTPGYFSFNVDGGRCEDCHGDGYITVEMQFMSDVTMVCEACGGKRFKEDILDVRFKEKNIFDVLEMTTDQAIIFFDDEPLVKKNQIAGVRNIVRKLKILSKVGLGYVKLGQATSTLSGGENQRMKLAFFISNETSSKPSMFIFDEPTTGLHFDDVKKLLVAFNELCDNGHTIIFIEHNIDMIKSADWVIDLGPEGGNEGGNIILEGTPEQLVKNKTSFTAKYLVDDF